MSHLLTSAPVDQVETMYVEGIPEVFVDQGFYYPTAANYGYYCSGFESPPVEWEDPHGYVGMVDPHFPYQGGVQTEGMPYMYYAPSYGYAESAYDLQNPCLAGAMVGVDDSYVGAAQQLYSVSQYQDAAPLPALLPVVLPPDAPAGPLGSSSLDATSAYAPRPAGRAWRTLAAPSPPKLSGQINASASCVGSNGQPLTHESAVLSRSTMGTLQPLHTQLNAVRPMAKDSSKCGTASARELITVDRLSSMLRAGLCASDAESNGGALGSQNYGARTNRSRSQPGRDDGKSQENSIASRDQYDNHVDFPTDYQNAKFFVIKSYSEDDVHKSVKYNVWSSTTNGNKKLQASYEDAQRIAAGCPSGCPIFLFFSVNASGQFCGLAEMTGPVDFYKDMDFWQQDKWNGSFPVKWHFIKDVSNICLRHIELENNENKPVTSSRDTQEIMYGHGVEMLKIFKYHPLKTSLMDDFTFYENRQKVVQEGKARLAVRRFEAPLWLGSLDPKPVRDRFSQLESKPEEQISSITDITSSAVGSHGSSKTDTTSSSGLDATSISCISRESNSKQEEFPSSSSSPYSALSHDHQQWDVFTVGSVPVKVTGFAVNT